MGKTTFERAHRLVVKDFISGGDAMHNNVASAGSIYSSDSVETAANLIGVNSVLSGYSELASGYGMGYPMLVESGLVVAVGDVITRTGGEIRKAPASWDKNLIGVALTGATGNGTTTALVQVNGVVTLALAENIVYGSGLQISADADAVSISVPGSLGKALDSGASGGTVDVLLGAGGTL